MTERARSSCNPLHKDRWQGSKIGEARQRTALERMSTRAGRVVSAAVAFARVSKVSRCETISGVASHAVVLASAMAARPLRSWRVNRPP